MTGDIRNGRNREAENAILRLISDLREEIYAARKRTRDIDGHTLLGLQLRFIALVDHVLSRGDSRLGKRVRCGMDIFPMIDENPNMPTIEILRRYATAKLKGD